MSAAPLQQRAATRANPWGQAWALAWPLRRLSWAEWRAHPWRQAAAVMAIALGVALAFSVHLIHHSALAEFAQALRSANGEPDLSLVPAQASAGLDERLLDQALLTPGVQAASPRVEASSVVTAVAAATAATTAAGGAGTSSLAHAAPSAIAANAASAASAASPADAASPAQPANAPARTSVRVIGVDALAVAAVAPDLMPRPSEQLAQAAGARALLDPQHAFVNAALARELGGATELLLLAQGRPLHLTLAGTVAAGGSPLLVLDVAAAQAALGSAGRLSRIDLRLQPGAEPAAVLAALKLPASVRVAAADEGQERMSNLSRAYRVNLTVLALVALVVGGYLVFSVVSLAVAQRTPGLALLGVLGLPAAGRQMLVLMECAVTGLGASLLGLLMGAGLAAAALQLLSGDLGSGAFGGETPALRLPWAAAAGFALLGTAAAVLGGWWPAARAGRLAPAQALKGLGTQEAQAPRAWPGLALLAAALLLALLPPWGDLPLAAYASVGAGLVGGIALLPWGVQLLLVRRSSRSATHALWLLALQRARFARSTATAAVAGVVASLALCVAITVMVASFREAVTQWLEVVLPADLYARASSPGGLGDQAVLPPALVASAASLTGVRRVEAGWVQPLSLSPVQPDIWLMVRPLGADPSRHLPLTGELQPVRPGEVGVFVSEAMAALYGAVPGSLLTLPLAQAPGAQPAPLRVRGLWRDYARQFGSVVMDADDHARLTGDTRRNELALWLAPDASAAQVQAALQQQARTAGGAAEAMAFATTSQLKRLSLQIFDRSFAVTRYLQAVAIAIGLAGVAASLSAQVLARRREFGLLAHLGLPRAQVLRLVTLEALCWLLAGVVLGVALGLAISAVLVLIVNPQSFHWTMDWRVPVPQVAALAAAVLGAGGLTSWLAARQAASSAAVRSVKEDW